MALPQRRTPESDPGRPPDSEHPATAPASASDWHALYEIENPADVDAYVAEHPTVASVLAEAPAEIAAAFEEDPRLILRYALDPEDEPATDYLVVDVMTMRDSADAHDRLNRFDEDWWLDASLPVARAGAVVVIYPRIP
jgi:hypothetical protein